MVLFLVGVAQAQSLGSSLSSLPAAADAFDAAVGIYTFLTFTALVVGWLLLRLRRWVQTELNPLLDRLHRAASAWEARTPQPVLLAWRPAGPLPPLRLPVIDAPWAGVVHVCADDGPIAPYAEAALELPGLGLCVVAPDGVDLADPRAAGRVFGCADPAVTGPAFVPLIEAMRARAGVVLLLFDLRGALGGADPVERAALMGRRLADLPADGALFVVALLPAGADLDRLGPAAGVGQRVVRRG